MAYLLLAWPSMEVSSMPFFTEPGKKRDMMEGPTIRLFHATGQPSASSPATSFE
jgi:hypothetical protein